MMRNNRRRKLPERTFGNRRPCQFSLNDLVRIDFVFPYGRVAATGKGLMPEPFDRDAEFATNPKEMEEIKNRIMSLFHSN